ncbi:MAG: transcription termination factor NusA [Armatimonadota bacterium]
MNGELMEILHALERERDIPLAVLWEALETALTNAYKKHCGVMGEVRLRLDSSKTGVRLFCERTVVEEVGNHHTQISLEEAQKIKPDAEIGDIVSVPVEIEGFGRIAAQTAKQVIVQRLREAEREQIYQEFHERVGEILSGFVQRREGPNVIIDLDRVEAILPPEEQVPNEPYRPHDRLRVYLLRVEKTTKAPRIIVSRSHPSLIRRLFELEVPEIREGSVMIKAVAREPGARSKIAVWAKEPNIDPVGSCVGIRGTRVQAVVNELYDEKIDIIRWYPDPAQFIAEALSPAKVSEVKMNDAEKSALAIVPDDQLSLAIGKAGQNVRLAARLTGWKIDIRSSSQVSQNKEQERQKA